MDMSVLPLTRQIFGPISMNFLYEFKRPVTTSTSYENLVLVIFVPKIGTDPLKSMATGPSLLII